MNLLWFMDSDTHYIHLRTTAWAIFDGICARETANYGVFIVSVITE